MNDPRARARGVESGDQRLAEQRVDDDVDASLAGLRECRGQVWLLERHGGVGAALERPRQTALRARRGDHTARAEYTRGLHRDLADDAARTEHEHVLAGPQFRAPGQREPPDEAPDAERHRQPVGDVIAYRQRRRGIDQRPLRHRAERRDRRIEVDAAPLERRHGLSAGDGRQRRPAAVERAGRKRHIDWIQAGGEHLDDGLPGSRDRLLELCGGGHAVVAQNCRAHRRQLARLIPPLHEGCIMVYAISSNCRYHAVMSTIGLSESATSRAQNLTSMQVHFLGSAARVRLPVRSSFATAATPRASRSAQTANRRNSCWTPASASPSRRGCSMSAPSTAPCC